MMNKEVLSEILDLVYHNHLTAEYATELIFIELEKANLIIEKNELTKILEQQIVIPTVPPSEREKTQ